MRIVNSSHNKVTYGTLSGAIALAIGYFTGLSTEVAGALTVIVMAVVVERVPNRKENVNA